MGTNTVLTKRQNPGNVAIVPSKTDSVVFWKKSMVTH